MKIEKKIFAEHKTLCDAVKTLRLQGASEAEAKEAYIKLSQQLPTFGVDFFLVKVDDKLYTRDTHTHHKYLLDHFNDEGNFLFFLS